MIKVFTKADKIFELVSRHAPISFSNLQKLTELNKATLSQILSSMIDLEWLRKDEKGNYRIGNKLVEFGESSIVNPKLYDVCKRFAKKLNYELDELVTISIFYNGKRKVIIKCIPNHVVQVNEDYDSSPESMFTTATGIVLFTGLNSSIRDTFVKDHKLKKEFLAVSKQISEVAQLGYCELFHGNNDCVAYASGIYDADGLMVATLGFSLPCYRQEFDKNSAGKILKKYSRMISENL
jgi:DNA-binding IclR family transcriptional regulator